MPRNELLDKEYNNQGENKLAFNVTYYFAFQKIQTTLEELRILLAPDKEQCFLMFLLSGFVMGQAEKNIYKGVTSYAEEKFRQ